MWKRSLTNLRIAMCLNVVTVSTDVDNVKVDVPTDDNVIDTAEDTKPDSN